MGMPRAKRKQLEIVDGDVPALEDKRAFCRFALPDIPVRFKDLRSGLKGEMKARDIGGGGAGVECAQEIKPRTPVELWFDLPDGFEPLHLLGKTVWSRPSGTSWRLGISFERQRLMSMTRVLKLGG